MKVETVIGAAAKAAGVRTETVRIAVGHHQMTETPDETLFAIRDFITP